MLLVSSLGTKPGLWQRLHKAVERLEDSGRQLVGEARRACRILVKYDLAGVHQESTETSVWLCHRRLKTARQACVDALTDELLRPREWPGFGPIKFRLTCAPRSPVESFAQPCCGRSLPGSTRQTTKSSPM